MPTIERQRVFSLESSKAPRTRSGCASAVRLVLVIVFAAALGACATLPPGSDFPKIASAALVHPEETRLGGRLADAVREHGGDSAFRIVTAGVDGFVIRAEMIDTAERTLDLQYYIFRGDETGKLLSDALLRAADRGVRVRVLVDDGDTLAGDEQIIALDAHPAIEIRIFNPFVYRGHKSLLRGTEFLFNSSRLDYRMHNKLMVVDNAVALVGGRNIGNQYFQMDPESQFADVDVLAAGPVAGQLSATFDEYWNSPFAIPAEALHRGKRRDDALEDQRERPQDGRQVQALQAGSIDYLARIATGEPYAGMISGQLPLVWSRAQVICDSPDKKRVEGGMRRGRLMTQSVAVAAEGVQSELLMITPYFIPADEELKLLQDMRKRNARVRVITNSLKSSGDVIAQSGYMRYRVPLLEDGVELYEVRALLGSTRGSGQTARMSRHGNYGLHAKLIVFDRKRLFVGSMNFDQRSKSLNTEVGLIIDSPELAQQTSARFDAMARPENSYELALAPASAGSPPRLLWRTQENGASAEYSREPARSWWQRFELGFFAMLPIEGEL